MVSTFTPNINLEEPARGDYVGTWDTPVNANMTLLDLVAGGRTTINGAAGSVVLSAAQFQCKTITFNSTLLASITVTFPTSFTKGYTIRNLCTGSSAFTITLATTAGGQVICAPPGEAVDIINDGTNMYYVDIGRIGSYWDYAGSSVPAWVSGCTVPPFLNCDVSTFSSATYPQLATILGGTTLPDSRGRLRAALNQGTARLSSAGAGIDGNTNRAAGGNNGVTLSASQIPTLTSSGTAVSPQNNYVTATGTEVINFAAGTTNRTIPLSATVTAINSGAGATVTSIGTGGGIVPATVPVYVGGITMIRAG